jgi:hypothetical protein
MTSSPPALVAIDADDYHAEHVGRTLDGRQFFLTTPFEPATRGKAGCEFVALYTFDEGGKLIAAEIDSFGPRETMDDAARKGAYDARLQSLGKVSFERIVVAPFALEKFGTTFGLVVRQPEDEDDPWAVEVQPGNYMAFFEPWDSGEYDT